ncbi:MAG: hypothetical protein FWF95_00300 [Syntrophorhabdaceae bacterium]|nr:hypothetical protein [Syntrophorhabdaceae bacterium]
MKRICRNLLMSALFLAFLRIFAGCSGGDWHFVFTAEIMSDQLSDGHIRFTEGPPDIYDVTQGPSTLFFGFDADGREYRAFLDFPLDGSSGQDVIPRDAKIESATLTARIVSMNYASTVQTLLDLVSYTPRGLISSDYDALLLTSSGSYAYRAFDLFSSDVGRYVKIDVTSLMREAQALGLSEFQARFCLDFIPGADGFVGIDDSVAFTAPLLIVRYYF